MYKPTIGLEIHAELKTASKMFCSCKNDPEEKKPNTNVCPVCLAHPGTLPTINKKAVEKVIKTAMSLNCKINKESFFERKNYFYPDLPKGYQISQYLMPLGKDGYLDIEDEDGSRKRIRIERIHLEEDTGSLIHSGKGDYSLVDYNRAGVPLMELVTEPDIKTAYQAKAFASGLQMVLRYLGVSDADMEKGEMRCEVNISMLKASDGDTGNDKATFRSKDGISNLKLGTKVEIKNLNSLRAVERAIAYEIERQTEVLKAGGKVVQETRGWDDKKGITFSQRKKEESHDYRYFPEPDLLPLEISDEFLEEVKAEIPELPLQRKQRFKKEYFLPDKEINLYTSQKELGDYFEKVISELSDWIKSKDLKQEVKTAEFKKLAKLASNYIATDLQSLLLSKNINVLSDRFLITPENFAEFLSMIYKGEISSKIAKSLLKEMFETGKDPSQIIEDKDLKMIESEGEIGKVASEVLKENKKAVDDYKNGKETALQFLIGKLMAKTRGKASPKIAKDVLKKLLD